MACECIKTLNELWLPHGQMVDTALWTNLETDAKTVTVRIKSVVVQPKRGRRAETIVPAFCPFCGVAYKADDARTGGQERGEVRDASE